MYEMKWFAKGIHDKKDKLIRLLNGVIVGSVGAILLVILFAKFCI